MDLRDKIEKVKSHLIGLGFFVNDGVKYGLDILAYTAHPTKVHSLYGVVVSNGTSLRELIAYQRVCTSNNKILLVATVDAGGIQYHECRRLPTRTKSGIEVPDDDV